ncbi:hypothetical protein TruAng_006036 [Truncatella angustata]|nr:hypothetical protein TruAng_006036 [Truncatella angustata]
MSSVDWQTPLSSTLGLVLTSIGYSLTALYWAVVWLALQVVAKAPAYLYKTVSIVATPLTYPLYYIWRAVAFILSPVWALGRMVSGMGSWVVGVIVKFKFSVAALIGIFSACMLYGTSSIVFSLLGISPSSHPARRQTQGGPQSSNSRYELQEQSPWGDGDEQDRTSSSSSDSDDFPPRLGQPQRRSNKPVLTNREFEQAYRQAKSTRLSPIKPSRRFRGLLAQTIHEESSESG